MGLLAGLVRFLGGPACCFIQPQASTHIGCVVYVLAQCGQGVWAMCRHDCAVTVLSFAALGRFVLEEFPGIRHATFYKWSHWITYGTWLDGPSPGCETNSTDVFAALAPATPRAVAAFMAITMWWVINKVYVPPARVAYSISFLVSTCRCYSGNRLRESCTFQPSPPSLVIRAGGFHKVVFIFLASSFPGTLDRPLLTFNNYGKICCKGKV